jgi:hypothetical protein
LLLLAAASRANGPVDNQVAKVRPIPPKGIAVPDQKRAELQAGLDRLATVIDQTRQKVKDRPRLLELLPDVQIY